MRHSSSNFRLVPAYNVLQDQHRYVCGEPCDEFLRSFDSLYPPFQLIFDEDMGEIADVTLVMVCGTDPVAASYLNTAIRTVKDIDNDDVDEFVYTFSGGPLGGNSPGVYYVVVEFEGGELFYTETYYHPGLPTQGGCEDCKEYWWMEYSHSCDEKSLGDYSMGFLNKYFLGDIILFRDGTIENTVSRKDGFGVETIIATDIRPKWTFEVLGNSYLLDSLEFLKLFDQVYLKRSDNTDVFTLANIEVTAKGDTNDCFFPIKISFTKDVLLNTKCCDSVYEQAPVPANCDGMHVMTSENFAVCEGTTIELMATVVGGAAPFVYVWSNGETGQTIEVTPEETTEYIITVIDAFGCVKQDEVTITVVVCEGALVVDIVADPVSPVCEGTLVDLDASVSGGSGTYTYLWSTGATTQDISVTPTNTTVYSLTVTDTISGDVHTENITLVVIQNPNVAIVANGCNLSIAQIQDCEGTTVYLWQVETTPDTWVSASGANNGTTYSGDNGSTYRLKVTCSGCVGYSNEITVACSAPCTVIITDITYDYGTEELSVTYDATMGSNPFVTGYLVLNESLTPNIGNCAASGSYGFIISITLTAADDTVVIPFVPDALPACIGVYININAGECTVTQYEAILEE